MRTTPARAPARSATRFRRVRLRVGLGVGVLLALFILFEVGIRHVPPDGMRVRYETVTLVPVYDGSFKPKVTYTTYIYTMPKDHQTIDDTYASLNNGRAYYTPFDHFNCALTSAPVPFSIEFTWHGILLETWRLSGCTVTESAGGIYDTLGLTFHYWMPPWNGVPLPAPK